MPPTEQRQALDAVYAEIARLGAIIDAPPALLPTKANEEARVGLWLEVHFFEASDGDDEDGWWFTVGVVPEAWDGRADQECPLRSPHYLIEAWFEGVTHQMAMRDRRPIEGEDSRRSLFAIQEELLGRLNAEWAARKASRHAGILKNFPFQDQS